MTGGLEFDLDIDQNPYLDVEQTEVHAVLRITGRDLGEQAPEVERCEVIIVDCSGSMGGSHSRADGGRLRKIDAARSATATAIDVLPDGVRFAVVEGTERARTIYPGRGHLAVAGERTRTEAKAAVRRLTANGGTNIGTWLTEARRLLAAYPSALRHSILLTDGQNNEPAEVFEQALAACEGVFVCDARGIGEDWVADQLLRIAAVLRGSADAVLDHGDLAAEFRKLTEAALGKVTPQMRLRFTTTPPAKLVSLSQVHPTRADLTEHVVALGERSVELATGSWGEESRDYQVCFEVSGANAPHNEDLRIARVDLMVGEDRRGTPGAVLVHWTEDAALSAVTSQSVSFYEAQDNMSQAVDAGIAAYDRGDLAAAEEAWGRAVRLATKAGNRQVLDALTGLVEILDPQTGALALRRNLSRHNMQVLKLAGSHYAQAAEDPDPVPIVGRPWTCECGRVSPASARFCVGCGRTKPD